ncbi:MAG: FAD-dependent oxidoreductase [Puniceicoccaceae bacterium]
MAYDVVVAGGGPAGIGAAIAAARLTDKVALIERHDVLGGMGTAALVNNFCPAHLDGYRLIIGGIFADIRNQLIERKAIFATRGFEYAMEPYNPDVFATLLEEMVIRAGVDIFYRSQFGGVETNIEGNHFLLLRDGQKLIYNTLVDSTGDAIVANAAGVPYTFGRQKDRAVMPLTFCYKLGPIDIDLLRKKMPSAISDDTQINQPFICLSGAHQEVAAAQATGDLTIPRDHVASIMNIPGEPLNATVNFGRVFVEDPTDPEQLKKAEKIGGQQIEEGIRFFRKYLPGFEKVEIIERARQIGVRESRQIKGLYTLTGEDVLSCRQFEDVIAQCCYALDVHSPESSTTQLVELERGTHYDIPLRCLIPSEGPDNLIVAGRSISATQEAMSSFRVSPSAMAIGEAAGVTAALASTNRTAIRDVPYSDVRKVLLDSGGILS